MTRREENTRADYESGWELSGRYGAQFSWDAAAAAVDAVAAEVERFGYMPNANRSVTLPNGEQAFRYWDDAAAAGSSAVSGAGTTLYADGGYLWDQYFTAAGLLTMQGNGEQ